MMKKILLLLILFFSFFACQTSQLTVNVPDEVDLPNRVLFIAQSGTFDSLFQTVIDLENNEMVVLEYSNSILTRVYRTGIILNPDDYTNDRVSASDAPSMAPESTSDSEDTGNNNGPTNNGNPATSF